MLEQRLRHQRQKLRQHCLERCNRSRQWLELRQVWGTTPANELLNQPTLGRRTNHDTERSSGTKRSALRVMRRSIAHCVEPQYWSGTDPWRELTLASNHYIQHTGTTSAVRRQRCTTVFPWTQAQSEKIRRCHTRSD